jgi:hypothetical protein
LISAFCFQRSGCGGVFDHPEFKQGFLHFPLSRINSFLCAPRRTQAGFFLTKFIFSDRQGDRFLKNFIEKNNNFK